MGDARATDGVKPRVRVKAGSPTRDSYVNFATNVGNGANNTLSAGSYQFNFTSRNRVQIEAMYRSSWIVGQAVDVVADDMTRAGVEIQSDMDPQDIGGMQAELTDLCCWQRLNEGLRWSRLFGGCIVVPLIDGQKPSTPLRMEGIGAGKFRGLLVLDRWVAQPTLSDLVTEFGPDFGMPRYYDTIADAPALPRTRIHYSRVFRFDGVDLPYYQKQSENGWGMSVIERLYDRLLAFDSSTMGAAQLVNKAHLRVLFMEGLRQAIAMGGDPLKGVMGNLDMIRQYQSGEGLTLLDAKDKFETNDYSFGGLDAVLLQFGMQLSGALQIPLVRLFGQSPGGMNSTGESDLRTYYDGIAQQQASKLRRPMQKLLDIVHWSKFGEAPPDGFGFRFRPLWQMTEEARATTAQQVTTSVLAAYEAAVIPRKTALQELRQSSEITGIWSNITDEDIAAAEDDPPQLRGEEALTVAAEVKAKAGATGEAEPGEADNAPKPGKMRAHDGWDESEHPRNEIGEFSASKGIYKGAKLITTQRYLNDKIVENKVSGKDFSVQISPEFEVDGENYRVVLDGTHSYHAALKTGITPDFEEQSARDNDNIAYLEKGDVDSFLENVHSGEGDYMNISTEKEIW